METIYKISAGTCQITWTLYHSKVNEGAIRNESICSHSSLHQQTQLVSKILAKVLNDSGTPPKFNTLVFGTLASSPEMSARLAVLAKQSGGWDSRKGEPKSGLADSLIMDIANRGHLYDEWQEVFRQFRRKIKISGVENVEVMRANQLPYFGQIRERGIRETDRLPYDCLVWFAVSPIGESDTNERAH